MGHVKNYSYRVPVCVRVCVYPQLQEQLERFMKMNAELRHKQNVLQAQLKSTVERKADMEADLKEKHKEIENLQAQLDRTNSNSLVCMPLTQDSSYIHCLYFMYLYEQLLSNILTI